MARMSFGVSYFIVSDTGLLELFWKRAKNRVWAELFRDQIQCETQQYIFGVIFGFVLSAHRTALHQAETSNGEFVETAAAEYL